MNRTVVVYCTLMLFVVMGAFASMALNNYGVLIMSYASLAFSILFFINLIVLAQRTDMPAAGKRMRGIELAALVSLCFLLAFRGLTIDIPFRSIVIPVLLMILMFIHLFDFSKIWNTVGTAPAKMKVGIVCYFGTLFLLIGAFYLFGVLPGLALVFAMLSFLLLVIFFLLSGRRNAVIVEGEKTNPFHMVSGFKTKSAILMVGLALVISYNSLNTLDVLPPLYFGSMPNGYYKVAQQAKDAKAGSKAIDPESFEYAYKKFVADKPAH